MAGVTGTLSPSGDLNPGNLSIDGQRESSSGFMVNGIDVQEPMNGGTSVIPNLDSIEEFRVLTTFMAASKEFHLCKIYLYVPKGSDLYKSTPRRPLEPLRESLHHFPPEMKSVAIRSESHDRVRSVIRVVDSGRQLLFHPP